MTSNPPPSSYIIAANDDLLSEILIRLPIKSLLHFKSVSKFWFFLISSPHFCRRRNHHINKAISGLILERPSFGINPVYDFVRLHDNQPVAAPFSSINFVEDQLGVKILHSCNGLLCCRSFQVLDGKCNYYIYNPSTRQFIILPDPLHRSFTFVRGVSTIYAVNLAFDPRKSLYFKVVCIYFSKIVPDCYEIEIYSSETGTWRQTGDPFPAEVNFNLGVYWNGALNWLSYKDDALYFNINEERLGIMPMPPLRDGLEERTIRYFGESNDNLHLIEIHTPCTIEFDIYEMDQEYSGWTVKYHVDLEAVIHAFPDTTCNFLDPTHLFYYRFFIISVVEQDKDDDDDCSEHSWKSCKIQS